MLKLESLSKQHNSFWIVDEEFTIGCSLQNQMSIEGDGIQDVHANFYLESLNLYIKNTTADALITVNHCTITTKTKLKLNDVISLAGHKFKLIDPSNRHVKSTKHSNHDSSLRKDKLDTEQKTVWKIQQISDTSKSPAVEIKEKNNIGRDSINDIVITGTYVSRRHAEIYINSRDQLIVKDLGSANGTYVNGDLVEEVAIYLGDEISFDTDIFKVVTGNAATITDSMLNNKTQFRAALTEEDLSNIPIEQPILQETQSTLLQPLPDSEESPPSHDRLQQTNEQVLRQNDEDDYEESSHTLLYFLLVIIAIIIIVMFVLKKFNFI